MLTTLLINSVFRTYLGRGRGVSQFVDLTKHDALDIVEIPATMGSPKGDLNRLHKEVNELLGNNEDTDVENISSVLKIPFDYEALMQDSTEEDEESILDEGVGETEKSVLDTGNVLEEKAMVHNMDISSDVQPKISQTPVESSNEDVADHNNGISPCTEVNCEDSSNKLTGQMNLNLSPLNVTNYDEEPSLNSDSKDAKTSEILHDSDDTISATANDATVHNAESSCNIPTQESDVDNTFMKNDNIKEQPCTQNVMLGDSTITKTEDNENCLELLALNSNLDNSLLPGRTEHLLGSNSVATSHNSTPDDTDASNDSPITVENNGDAIPSDQNVDITDESEVSTQDRTQDGTFKINMISVKSGAEGMNITGRKQVTVRRKNYDQKDLSRDIGCKVKVRKLTKDDINLWKPLPTPLEDVTATAKINDDTCSSASSLDKPDIRRNPSRRAKYSVDYVKCQNDTSDTGTSDNDDEDYKLHDTQPQLNRMKEPSEQRIHSQQQIAIRKAAFALLKLRNSRGGGVGMADRDLQEMAGVNTNTEEINYELEYNKLTKHLDKDHTITGHNITDDADKEVLPAITTDNDLELRVITRNEDKLPVITDNLSDHQTSDYNAESDHTVYSDVTPVDDLNQTTYSSETPDEDSNDEENRKNDNEDEINSGSSQQAETGLRRSSRTNTVTMNKKIDTSDSNGNQGELNIKFIGRPKYKRPRKYSCNSCKKEFTNQRDYNQHYIDDHGRLRCALCGRPFNTPSALRKHNYEHSSNKISCTKCEKSFPFQSQLDSHMISHREHATFKCMAKNCTKWYKNKGCLAKHVKKHDGITHSCKYCDYTTDIVQNLNGHMMKHSGYKRYVCLHCGKGFRWSQERIRHYSKCPKLPSTEK